jgi:hypothetical protein
MEGNSERADMLLALFEPTTPIESVLEKLRARGVPDQDLEVESPLPLDPAMMHKPIRVHLYIVAIIAGIVGIGAGIFFAGGTAAFYPLLTGGKKIVAPPVVGIISYELMMLFAIVCTFLVMVMKIVWIYRAPLRQDPQIGEGKVAVVVRVEDNESLKAAVQAIFLEAGATEVRVV